MELQNGSTQPYRDRADEEDCGSVVSSDSEGEIIHTPTSSEDGSLMGDTNSEYEQPVMDDRDKSEGPEDGPDNLNTWEISSILLPLDSWSSRDYSPSATPNEIAEPARSTYFPAGSTRSLVLSIPQ